jgi:hypothetical protein
MIGKLVLIPAMLVGVASGQLASAPSAAPGPRGCGGPVAGLETAGPSALAARGRGLAAVHQDGVVMIDPTGERRVVRPLGRPELMRHVARRAGIGTAFVNDLAGPDVLVVMEAAGVTTIEGRGELTHPAWSPSGQLAWAVDLSALEVWSPATGARRLVPPPRGSSGIFSPVFTTPSELVAIVQGHVDGTHDDGLNDLWRYDLDSRTWSQLTRFRAGLDRWSVLRTPVVGPDGSVLFVRVAGRASATEQPSFELWALREGRALKIRDLPGERYLAGLLGGRLVWNVPDPATGEWRLLSEGPGEARNLGCGAVSVDPVTEPDPDFVESGGQLEDSDVGGPGEEPDPREAGRDLAILIGDFVSESQALVLAEGRRIAGALAVGHGDAPAAVRPGAWALVVPIPEGASPEHALAELRSRHPDLADRTWIVPFDSAMRP